VLQVAADVAAPSLVACASDSHHSSAQRLATSDNNPLEVLPHVMVHLPHAHMHKQKGDMQQMMCHMYSTGEGGSPTGSVEPMHVFIRVHLNTNRHNPPT
jgi:hypothetical protein